MVPEPVAECMEPVWKVGGWITRKWHKSQWGCGEALLEPGKVCAERTGISLDHKLVVMFRHSIANMNDPDVAQRSCMEWRRKRLEQWSDIT